MENTDCYTILPEIMTLHAAGNDCRMTLLTFLERIIFNPIVKFKTKREVKICETIAETKKS